MCAHTGIAFDAGVTPDKNEIDGSSERKTIFTFPSSENLSTREKVLCAATKVFSSKDFYHTKLEEIAELAGLGKGTIYLHFKDKNDLFVSTVAFSMNLFIEQTNEKLIGVSSPLMRLRVAIQIWLGNFIEYRMGILSFRSHTAMLPPEYAERLVEIRDRTRAFFSVMLDSMAMKFGHKTLKRSSELLSEVLFDAMCGYVSRPDFEEFIREYPPEKYAAFLVDVVLPHHEWMKEEA